MPRAVSAKHDAEAKDIFGMEKRYDSELKLVFGKYRIVAVDRSKRDGPTVVYLVSNGEHYMTKGRTGGNSWGYADDKKNVVFINLIKKGHWLRTEYSTIYFPSELSLTFLHEYLHTLRIGSDREDAEEKMVVWLERLLRLEHDYRAVVVK